MSDVGELLEEDRGRGPVPRLTTAVALTEWITTYAEVLYIDANAGEHLPSAVVAVDLIGGGDRFENSPFVSRSSTRQADGITMA